MSINVLQGMQHTHYDDIESFFYVLLLFFVSYNGPLPTSDLEAAHKRGFSQVLGSGRAQNICEWPEMFKTWSQSMSASAQSKALLLMPSERSVPAANAIAQHIKGLWGSGISAAIGNLILQCLLLFQGTSRVTHDHFIGVLDKWLEAYPVPPDGCNSCPFKASLPIHLDVIPLH
ncbi:hypothetical protein F5I97DRAFT_61084 [Phlebopus sp. FC_14]|nr:hypothetical protein F5I97DRAFT_61084 [Phlebopus sp. FC_14]